MNKPTRVLISSEVLGEPVVGTLISPVELFREPLWVIQLAREAKFGPFDLKFVVLKKKEFREME